MKELEDRHWFPSLFRNYQTDFIGFLVTRFHFYDPFVDSLRARSFTPRPLWDLCSGSGEPAISIFKECGQFTTLTLSDKFPNPSRSRDDRIAYLDHPADVLAMRFSRGTCYTMFNALHHFSDDEKLRIVQRVQDAGAMAFFVEVLEPSAPCLLGVLFAASAGNLLLAPFIRPFSVWRLFFTYVLPINLITIGFDGVVSVLRSRSARHYQALFTSARPGVQVLRLAKGRVPLIVIGIRPGP